MTAAPTPQPPEQSPSPAPAPAPAPAEQPAAEAPAQPQQQPSQEPQQPQQPQAQSQPTMALKTLPPEGQPPAQQQPPQQPQAQPQSQPQSQPTMALSTLPPEAQAQAQQQPPAAPVQQPQPQPPQQQPMAAAPMAAAPGAGYTSPIPIVKTHLGHALASEWTKIRSVRSTIWTLGVMVVLLLALGLGIAAIVSASGVDVSGESPLTLGFVGVLCSSICVITLGVLTVSSEYGTGMIRTTMTACPSRARVLTAKAAVFFVLVFVLTTVVAALVGALQTAIVDGGPTSGALWLRSTVGVGLYLATLGLLSLAVGALVRHSAGAITIMIGIVLLPVVLAFFMFSPALADLQEGLIFNSIPSQIIGIYTEGADAAGYNGPTGWQPLLIVIGAAAVALVAAFATLESRDV